MVDAATIANPAVIAFATSITVGLSRLKINVSNVAFALLSGYLLIAIGLKGGAALMTSSPGEAIAAVAAAAAISAITPLILLPWLERWVGLDRKNSAAVAAHYGSVSIVTFTIAIAFLDRVGSPAPSYAVAMAAAMELPAILVAIALSGKSRSLRSVLNTGAETLFGRASLLLIGGLVAGMALGESSTISIVSAPFAIVLTVFLALMGLKVARRIDDLKKSGIRLVAFAILAPLALGTSVAVLAALVGMDVGAATILGTLAASASYIAAPAAVSKAIPTASPAIYISTPLIVTFPFNVLVGIFIYYQLALTATRLW